MRKGGIEHDGRAFLAHVVPHAAPGLFDVEVVGGDVVLGEQIAHVLLVLRRDPGADLFRGEGFFLAVEASGNEQVDAVGLAVDLVVDPGQLDVERLRRMADGAEHAEAPGVAHGGDHVAAMAEGDERELAAEHVTYG